MKTDISTLSKTALLFRSLLKNSVLVSLCLALASPLTLLADEEELEPIGQGRIFEDFSLGSSGYTPMGVSYYDQNTNTHYLLVFWNPAGLAEAHYTYATVNPELKNSLMWSEYEFTVMAPSEGLNASSSEPFKSTNRPEPVIHDNKLFVFGRSGGNNSYVYYDLSNGINNLIPIGENGKEQAAKWEGPDSPLFGSHHGMLSVINKGNEDKLVFGFMRKEGTIEVRQKGLVREGIYDPNEESGFKLSETSSVYNDSTFRYPIATPGLVYHQERNEGRVRAFFPITHDDPPENNTVRQAEYEDIDNVTKLGGKANSDNRYINTTNRPFPISFNDDLYLLWKKHGSKKIGMMWNWLGNTAQGTNRNEWRNIMELDLKTNEAASAVAHGGDLYVLYTDNDENNVISYQIFPGPITSNSMSMIDVEDRPDCAFTFETRGDEDFAIYQYRSCSTGTGAAAAEDRFEYGPIKDNNTGLALTSQGVPFAAEISGNTFLIFNGEDGTLRMAQLVSTDNESWVNGSSQIGEGAISARTSPSTANYRNRLYTFYSESGTGNVMSHWMLNNEDKVQAIPDGAGGFITTSNRPFAFSAFDGTRERVFVFYRKNDGSNQIGYLYADAIDGEYALQWEGGEHTLDVLTEESLTAPSVAVLNNRLYVFSVSDQGYFYTSTPLGSFDSGLLSSSAWETPTQLTYEGDALAADEVDLNYHYPIGMLATTVLGDPEVPEDTALAIGYYNGEGEYIELRCESSLTASDGTLSCE